jgi:DNA-directed RNA polymerase specialized sigma24 family protein
MLEAPAAVTNEPRRRIMVPKDMNTATAISDALRLQFTTLLEQHRRMVFKVANTYARAADREDLAQEIAAQLWRVSARGRSSPAGSFCIC